MRYWPFIFFSKISNKNIEKKTCTKQCVLSYNLLAPCTYSIVFIFVLYLFRSHASINFHQFGQEQAVGGRGGVKGATVAAARKLYSQHHSCEKWEIMLDEWLHTNKRRITVELANIYGLNGNSSFDIFMDVVHVLRYFSIFFPLHCNLLCTNARFCNHN